MRKFWLLVIVSFLPASIWGQTPQFESQNLEIERIRELVDAGVLPRNQLAEAEEILADAHDKEVLQKTLYGSLSVEDLTEDQADHMTAAAKRRLERQQQVVEKEKHLVGIGARSRTSMLGAIEELDYRRKILDLAESRARLLKDLAGIVRAESTEAEYEEQSAVFRASERYDGNGVFRRSQLKTIEYAYEREFAERLPISAYGLTAVHRALGFDHRDRVDVALNPDQKEGQWLRRYLENHRIPYFAFRVAIPGKATAPHIHIGPPSGRLPAAD